MKSPLLPFLFALAVMFNSCESMTPCGFWSSYQTDYLVAEETDNGPYGGHNEFRWQGDKYTFSAADVIQYAVENDWEFVDSSTYCVTDTTFYLDLMGDEYSNIIFDEHVVRALTNNCVVLQFKSGWMAIQPGNEIQTDINGFVVVSNDRSELFVYQLWGE